MLIRFGCSNFKSVFGYQEILLTASSLKDKQSFLISNEGFNEEILPSAGIYGANASGKTNFISALQFFVSFISRSHTSSLDSPISIPIFKLSSAAEDTPSTFDIDAIIDNNHYHYGFSIESGFVVEEWLFEYSYANRKSKKILFHRNSQEESEFYFGASLKGKNKQIADITKNNSLFLSVAANSKHELLGSIYRYFKSKFNFRFNQSLHEEHIAETINETGTLEKIVSFMTNLQTGIQKMDVVTEEISPEEKLIRDKIVSVLWDDDDKKDENSHYIKLSNKNSKVILRTTHKRDDGKDVSFRLNEESLGTRAAVALLAPLFNALENGGLFVIDEIESSLHPLLTLEAVKLFNDKEANPNGAQLIFTTHETSILCGGVLRRDQIWLSEKDLGQATTITPLTDFKTRNTDNIRSGYLEGRFGAIPFFGNIVSVMSDEGSIGCE